MANHQKTRVRMSLKWRRLMSAKATTRNSITFQRLGSLLKEKKIKFWSENKGFFVGSFHRPQWKEGESYQSQQQQQQQKRQQQQQQLLWAHEMLLGVGNPQISFFFTRALKINAHFLCPPCRSCCCLSIFFFCCTFKNKKKNHNKASGGMIWKFWRAPKAEGW